MVVAVFGYEVVEDVLVFAEIVVGYLLLEFGYL